MSTGQHGPRPDERVLNLSVSRTDEAIKLDASCQDVGSFPDDLEKVQAKVAQLVQKTAGRKVLVDLSLNRLSSSHLSVICNWLETWPVLCVDLTGNNISWFELRDHLLGRNALRWVKELRITLANQPGQLQVQDMLTRAILAWEATATTVNKLAEQTANNQNWQKTENFVAETEVNQALEEHLHASGFEVDVISALTALLKTDGKTLLSFDGAYYTKFPPTIYLVETKHHLEASDVSTALGKVKKFKQLLSESSTYTDKPEHHLNYQAMMAMLKKFSAFEVKLVMGGSKVDDNVLSLAKAGKCVLISPSGQRYSVVPEGGI